MKVILSLLAALTFPVEILAQTAATRKELEAVYQRNTSAFLSFEVKAVMALRAPEFHTVTPDGTTRDRAAMETYTVGLLNGVKKWNRITFTIDSLRVSGDTAFAIVSQHLDRMALRPDNMVHHVQSGSPSGRSGFAVAESGSCGAWTSCGTSAGSSMAGPNEGIPR